MPDNLHFDPDGHVYTRNGLVVPNVTSVIEATLDQFAVVPQDRLDYARELGTAVHEATALYDADDLDIDSLDLAILPYLEAWIQFRSDTGFVPYDIEQRLFHPRHFYAGTLDRTGTLFGKNSLIDIKSGVITPAVGAQTAAYMEARNYRTKDKLTARWVVQLKNDATYRLEQLKGKEDFSVFLSLLCINQWRIKHGI